MKIEKKFLLLISFFLFSNSTEVSISQTQTILKPKTQKQLEASKLLSQSYLLLDSNNPFKARSLLTKAVALWSEEPTIHYNLGYCYHLCAQYDAAILEFKQALKINPKMFDCLINIGSCYQAQGKSKEAIEIFKSYLRSSPKAKDINIVKDMIAALEKDSSHNHTNLNNTITYLDKALVNGSLKIWPKERMPLRIYIANGRDEKGNKISTFKEQYNYIFLEALNDWVKASNYKIAYRIVSNPVNAEIACTWSDNPNFSKQKGSDIDQGNTEVFSDTENSSKEAKEIKAAHIRLFILNRENLKPLNEEELKKMCLHELGHAFGIAGHSDNCHDVMFFSNSTAIWPALTKRDKATIQKMYDNYPNIMPLLPPKN